MLRGNHAFDYQYLNDHTGLIPLTDYYGSTTATETTPGAAGNYQLDTKIEQGDQGAPILQESMTYFAHSDGNGGANNANNGTGRLCRKRAVESVARREPADVLLMT